MREMICRFISGEAYGKHSDNNAPAARPGQSGCVQTWVAHFRAELQRQTAGLFVPDGAAVLEVHFLFGPGKFYGPEPEKANFYHVIEPIVSKSVLARNAQVVSKRFRLDRSAEQGVLLIRYPVLEGETPEAAQTAIARGE